MDFHAVAKNNQIISILSSHSLQLSIIFLFLQKKSCLFIFDYGKRSIKCNLIWLTDEINVQRSVLKF